MSKVGEKYITARRGELPDQEPGTEKRVTEPCGQYRFCPVLHKCFNLLDMSGVDSDRYRVVVPLLLGFTVGV